MTTLEMIFSCDECTARRQFGNGENLLDKPANRNPVIQCEGLCHRATLHTFVKTEIRSPEREKTVSQLFISVDRHLPKPSHV